MPNVSRADCVPTLQKKTRDFADYCDTAMFNGRPTCNYAWNRLIDLTAALRNVTGPMPDCELEKYMGKALDGDD